MSKFLTNLPCGVTEKMVSDFFDYEETVVGPQDPITDEDIEMEKATKEEEKQIEVLIGLMCFIDNINGLSLFEEDGRLIQIKDSEDINDLCLDYLEELDDENYEMAFSFIESHFEEFKGRLLDKINNFL